MLNVTISIVSHGHDDLVKNLLSQLAEYNEYVAKVIVTQNILSNVDYGGLVFPFEFVHIKNTQPLGFGENHNRAFDVCSTEYYCIMNPDIILNNDPFCVLLACCDNVKVAIISTLITDIAGVVEDSARYFPTPLGLLKKVFRLYDGVFPINKNEDVIYPEWVGGMFMLVKSDKYKALSGFDESYFLYYEDVDFCLRAWDSGNGVALCKTAVVVHDARRESHRKFKFLKWHLSSVTRFFIKHLGRFPKVNM